MAYTLSILPQAKKDISALPRKHQRQVVKRIRQLADDPRPQGARPLKQARKARQEKLWRWRSGKYRIIYQIRDDALVVVVVLVGDRKDVYERLSGQSRDL